MGGSVRTMIAPGSRPPRGGATFASLLSGVGRWGARERVRFPPPVGWRTVYRTIEAGDVDVVRELFDGASAEFKVGFDLGILGRGLEVLSWLRRRSLAPEPRRIGKLLAAVVRVLSCWGTEVGAVRVEAAGASGTYSGTVVARERGYRIPSVLAAIAVDRLLRGQLRDARLDRWLPDVEKEFSRRGLELIERRNPG